MFRLTLFLSALLILGGCAKPEKKIIWEAEYYVENQLKDPSSAKFRKSYLVVDEVDRGFVSGHVCGEVNAKNSFGAYAGFTRYVASVSFSKRSSSVYSVKIETGSEPKYPGSDLTSFDTVYWIPSCEKESNIQLLESGTASSKKMKRL